MMLRSMSGIPAALVLAALYPGLGYCGISDERPSLVSPSLPLEYVDTTVNRPSGRAWNVAAGGDLQSAIDAAEPGDEIVLQAGAQFQGPFSLPNKQGEGWITIRSSKVGKDFPAPGSRVRPSDAGHMAALVSRRDGVVVAERRAHHFRFIGIEMRPMDGAFLRELVQLGDNTERVVEDLPHHIIVDRCFLHGDPKKGARRGVFMNGRHMAVVDSHVSDIKEVGQDSQAVSGYAGSGPFKIVNNYLEAAGENILFGGGDPAIHDLVPSDIEIRRNHVAKPLVWKPGEPGHDGQPWQVKILLELKNARRVLVDGNVFEFNWLMPGYGFAITFTVRNEGGRSPWATIEDVTFTNNIVRHSPNGVNILAQDDIHPPSGRAQRILIKNNLFADIDGTRWGGKGRLFQLLYGTRHVVIEHNTAFHTGHLLMAAGEPHRGFVYRYNITPHNEYGMEGEGTGTGAPTLERHFPGAVVTGNVIIGGDPLRYPEGNFFPESADGVPFANRTDGDYRLSSSGSFMSAAPDTPGVDAAALCAALGENGRREPMCAKSAPSGRSDKPRAVGARE